LAVVVRVADEQQSKAQMQADGKEFGQDGALVALGEGLDLLDHVVRRHHDSGSQQPSCNSNLMEKWSLVVGITLLRAALCLTLDT
jgi:hypothetical protein